MKPFMETVSLIVVGLFISGCAVYTPKDIKSVEQLVSEAASAGAEKKAAYEYYSAVEHLNVAKDELSEADDKNAKVFGEKAQAMAEKAIQKSK